VIEGVDKWAGERVADDHEEADPLLRNHRPEPGGIEAASGNITTAPPP
jgi:hypothetical protein